MTARGIGGDQHRERKQRGPCVGRRPGALGHHRGESGEIGPARPRLDSPARPRTRQRSKTLFPTAPDDLRRLSSIQEMPDFFEFPTAPTASTAALLFNKGASI